MLTDTQAKKARGAEKPYKLTDGGGLFLLVSPTGNRSWRMKYRFGGKEKLLTFGTYAHVSLIKAREERERAKVILREGRDPSVEKKQAAAARSLGHRTPSRRAPAPGTN
ncbi:Arm DNA-binding domain-containing protein [Sphingomonas endolithica]|uniref:Arm DNA-binding domain-containing protein n=1 Tax=Sphingomonas endolithica TaxID=2972485 RepID=UPI0021AE9846|nr:Arm DNA-binding domain-containing protein [Sphingomonas sp. ZFBP2030]